jgi:hypothetical protein
MVYPLDNPRYIGVVMTSTRDVFQNDLENEDKNVQDRGFGNGAGHQTDTPGILCGGGVHDTLTPRRALWFVFFRIQVTDDG